MNKGEIVFFVIWFCWFALFALWAFPRFDIIPDGINQVSTKLPPLEYHIYDMITTSSAINDDFDPLDAFPIYAPEVLYYFL